MIHRGRSAKDSASSIFDPNQDNLPAINDFCITDSWTTTYNKMIDSGWTWEKGTGLYDYVYFKPGIKITEGHELNKDFFADEETLREYVKEFYGWTDDNRENKSTTKTIKQELIKHGYNTPLVADIHFTPNAAEVAARLIEKVRVNPGNYADKKKFEEIEYTDTAYEEELKRIEKKSKEFFDYS